MSLKSSQSPRANRKSTENPLAHAKGEVRLNTTRPASVPGKGSNLRMEDVNGRAAPTRRSAKKGV
jgi:hypothetical protein